MATRVTRSRRQLHDQQQEQQSRARWTPSLTKILADIMVDQVHRENRQNNSFGKKAWRHMCDEFYTKTGLQWDMEQLKNHYAALKRQYDTVKLILDRNDFSWDESTGSIVAADQVWVKYIKEHPDAEPLKSGGCPIFKELCTIFAEPATNGKHDYSTVCVGGVPSALVYMEPLSMHHEESSSESGGAEDVDDHETIQPTTPTTTSNRKRGRKGIDDAIAGAILEMAASSKLRAAAIKQRNTRYSIANCIKELDVMQGVDQQLYFAALDLFNKPIARETFLSLKGNKRLTWLLGKCSVVPNTVG
ncbi:L10-interacting MYB domain-containing protein-like [Quillaja saponaria]|uniref:L10-interacting MYB domain-containing protein-like n=1 Tax=Quillaja saponaria TaxID=32244 RepID=A0AAD7P6Q4_QUISA|nr:L10-interacting MYB domain-containing protein-like [Quillaja saponaria]